jgi:hypothetical protein
MPVSEKMGAALYRLRALKSAHDEVGKRILSENPQMFPVDLLAFGVLNRSLHLIFGFASLVESGNLIAAMPLLRLQLDTFIRFAAAWLVDSPQEFANKILGGEPVKKLKSRDKKPMTDRYLVETFACQHPWLTLVYERTSGYVHLSRTHTVACLSDENSAEPGAFQLAIGTADTFIDEAVYLEATEAFAHLTQIILQYCTRWADTKNHFKRSAMAPSAEEEPA